jgi:dipeptidyl aminopeptidase/acylaminoacyl peptidase
MKLNRLMLVAMGFWATAVVAQDTKSTRAPNSVRGGQILHGLYDAQSGRMKSLSAVGEPQENNTNPEWSPDGKYLAYISERGNPGGNAVIVIHSVETNKTVRELRVKTQIIPTENGGLAGWAPNGRSLLVMGKESNGRHGAFRVDVETGNAEILLEISNVGPGLWPTWSPEGLNLYYTKRSSGLLPTFHRRDLATGIDVEILRRPYLGGILVSPDGTYIATSAVDLVSDENLLLLIPLKGGIGREFMRISRNKGERVTPTNWTADSRTIVVRKGRSNDTENELWQVPLDGGVPLKLDSVLEAHVFAFKISPDGSRAAYRRKNP